MTATLVETTVLTDYLLKRDGSEKKAAAAFKRFDDQLVPHFAWKEFKRGPLKNFVWAHNNLVDSKSFLGTMAALQRMSRSPRRYTTSTAIQALHSAFARMFDNWDQLKKTYGPKANPDELHADALRLELKRIIHSSWKRRSGLFGGPFHLLSCYPDAPLGEKASLLVIDPRDCPKGAECCLKQALVKSPSDLKVVRDALKPLSDRQEVARRGKVIKRLEKHSSSLMTPEDCQSLGDAYFVFFCPRKATILTTNLRDIQPMADALGVKVEAP